VRDCFASTARPGHGDCRRSDLFLRREDALLAKLSERVRAEGAGSRSDAGGYFYSANLFTAPEHGGTHLDCANPFLRAWIDRRQDSRAPARCAGGGDRCHNASDYNPDYRLTVEELRAWEAANGTIQSGAIVMLRTGWGKRYGDRKAYFGDDTPGATNKLHFPSFGADAARILVNERHVGAIGVDTPSIDYGQSSDFIVHQIAAAGGVPGLENVANLESLPVRGSVGGSVADEDRRRLGRPAEDYCVAAAISLVTLAGSGSGKRETGMRIAGVAATG
jgi:kynurenine formamidase